MSFFVFGCSNSRPSFSISSSNNYIENSVSSASVSLNNSVSPNIEAANISFEEIKIDYPIATSKESATCSYRTFPGERIITSKQSFDSLNEQYPDFRAERENRIDSAMEWNSECLILFDYQTFFRKHDLFVSGLFLIKNNNNELLSNLLVKIYSESAYPMVDTDIRRKQMPLEKNKIFFMIKCTKSSSLSNARYLELDGHIEKLFKR